MGQEGTMESDVSLPTAPQNGNRDASTASTPQAKAMQDILDVIGEEPKADEPKEEQKKEPTPTEEPKNEPEAKPESKERVAQLEFVLPDGTKQAIPDDAKITIKVDKKEEEVTLADLKRNYQGKVPLDRYHQQSAEEKRKLDEERIAFYAEKKRFESNRQGEGEFVDDLYKTMTEGKDPAGALMKLCKRYRKDPGKVMVQIIDQARATVEHVEKLTPEQLEVYLQRLSLAQEKDVHEEDKKLSEQEKERQRQVRELQMHIVSECKKHSITEQEYVASEGLLRALVSEGKVDVSKTPVKEIANTIIAHVLQYQRPQVRLREVVARVDKKLADNLKFIDKIHHVLAASSESRDLSLQEYADSAIEEIVRGFAAKPNGAPPPAQTQTQPTEASSTGSPAKAAPGTIPQKKEEVRADVEEDDLDPLDMKDILRSYKR